jgi:hypothetical protein
MLPKYQVLLANPFSKTAHLCHQGRSCPSSKVWTPSSICWGDDRACVHPRKSEAIGRVRRAGSTSSGTVRNLHANPCAPSHSEPGNLAAQCDWEPVYSYVSVNDVGWIPRRDPSDTSERVPTTTTTTNAGSHAWLPLVTATTLKMISVL